MIQVLQELLGVGIAEVGGFNLCLLNFWHIYLITSSITWCKI